MEFDDFDCHAFLRDYWQQRPLLIRNPWKAWRNPLEADELAGLACETEVESRLIIRTGGGWQVEHGPFAQARFGQLGTGRWTLLVQAVDHAVPAVAALLEPFRFVPNWRVDDVMVSYATDEGGVGPHFDRYDVFLIQGLGRRRWRIGASCDRATALAPHDDPRLLADFTPTAEWILEPGDILYVPPGVAHDGIAVGDDCMTYSIGFRAPSRGELIAHWCEHLLAGLDEDDRYGDPGLTAQVNPGEIADAAIARLHAMVTAPLLDPDAFARWFGQYNTTPKYPEIDWRPEKPVGARTIRKHLADGRPVRRNPASRFAFIRRGVDTLWLFVDGERLECAGEAAALAEALCARAQLRIDPTLATSVAARALLETLFAQGSVAFDETA